MTIVRLALIILLFACLAGAPLSAQIVDELAILAERHPLSLSFIEENASHIFGHTNYHTVDPKVVHGVNFAGSSITNVPLDLVNYDNLRYSLFEGTKLLLNEINIAQIARIKSLQYLNLTGIGATNIPIEIEKLSKLHDLRSFLLSHNSIFKIPISMYKLWRLRELHMNRCQLRFLPPGISNLTNLVDLTLDFNPLNEFPRDFSDTIILRLSIAKCQFTGKSLANLPPTLLSLEASINNLDVFPDGVFAAKKLRHLFLNRNRIQAIPANIAVLAQLNGLTVRNNAIKKLPIEISAMTNLTLLDLTGNPLAPIQPELEALVSKQVIITNSDH